MKPTATAEANEVALRIWYDEAGTVTPSQWTRELSPTSFTIAQPAKPPTGNRHERRAELAKMRRRATS